MKPVLVAVVAILAMGLIGWITFGDSKDKTTITIEKKEIQEDTRKAVDKGKELFDEAKENLKKSEHKTIPRESTRLEESPPKPDRQPSLDNSPSGEQP